MTDEAVHFSVDGEGMTHLARNAMLSERPDVAWRLVAKGLIGDEYGGESVAEAILDGKLKLVNHPSDPNLLSAIDDWDAGYRKTLHYIYAGRIRLDGCWWRPVATVSGFTAESAKAASAALEIDPEESPGAVKHQWSRLCAEWFVDPGEKLILIGNRWTIWAPCGEAPFWWTPIASPELALQDALNNGRPMEERGSGLSSAEVLQSIQDRAKKQSRTAVRAYSEVEQQARDDSREAQLSQIGEKVRQQAGADTFTLRTATGQEFEVPRAPFWHWALRRTDLSHHAPPWEPVSPPGLKLMFDDPYHSDWMLGAGIELSGAYSSDAATAAINAMFELQQRLGDFEVTVLVDHGVATGVVGTEIAVVPNLSPAYAEAAMNPALRAIVAEEGGALAHLANVGRERGLTIVRVPHARELYPPGTALLVDPKAGRVEVQ